MLNLRNGRVALSGFGVKGHLGRWVGASGGLGGGGAFCPDFQPPYSLVLFKGAFTFTVCDLMSLVWFSEGRQWMEGV